VIRLFANERGSLRFAARTRAPSVPRSGRCQVEKLWSVPNVADVLSVSTKSVWRLIGCGDIPAVTVSPRRTLIDPSDVRAYIDSRKLRWTRRSGNCSNTARCSLALMANPPVRLPRGHPDEPRHCMFCGKGTDDTGDCVQLAITRNNAPSEVRYYAAHVNCLRWPLHPTVTYKDDR
jgi:predicted DNA-binding transcriptional regulator AlpA